MALRIRIGLRAAQQIRTADAWWRVHRPAAAQAVKGDVASALRLLAVEPGIGTLQADMRTPAIRRLFLARIGYWVYYTSDEQTLDVLAFWHASRGSPPRL